MKYLLKKTVLADSFLSTQSFLVKFFSRLKSIHLVMMAGDLPATKV